MIHGFERLCGLADLFRDHVVLHRGNPHQTKYQEMTEVSEHIQIGSAICDGLLGRSHKRFGDDMVETTG